jgi:ribonuclease P protein component
MLTTPRRQTLRKTERLYEKKAIDTLFAEGESITQSPVRLLWKRNEGESKPSVKAAFTVPRKNFKKAVDRNLLKRRMREAYRKNKYILIGAVDSKLQHYHLMFVYISREKVLYKEIETKIVLTLQRLASKSSGK